MSILLSFNGQNYVIPTVNEVGWGTNLDDYFVAIAASTLQKVGGNFTLTNEVDFGANYGLKSKWLRSKSVNIATTGYLQLAQTDKVVWRNNTNTGDLALEVNASNQLVFDGNVIGLAPAGIVFTTGDQNIGGNKTFTSDIIGNITGNAATVTNGVYTTGNQSISGTKTFNSSMQISGFDSFSSGNANLTRGSFISGGIAGFQGSLVLNSNPNTISSAILRVFGPQSGQPGGQTNLYAIAPEDPVFLGSPTTRNYTIPDVKADCDFVMAAGAQTIAGVKSFSSDIRPNTDISSSCGQSDHRFQHIWGQTIHSGDVQMENNWKITEGEKVGHPEEGIMFISPEGKKYKILMAEVD